MLKNWLKQNVLQFIMIDKQYSWLTEDFVAKLVQKTYPNENILINSVQIENLLPEGEKCASDLQKIVVKYSNDGSNFPKNICFIQKSQPEYTIEDFKTEENVKDMQGFRDMAFGREIDFYANFADKIDAILRNVNFENISFFPRYLRGLAIYY